MHFLIITHVRHTFYAGNWYAYAPYVREMNCWLKFADEVTLLAPVSSTDSPLPIDLSYNRPIRVVALPPFHLQSISGWLQAITGIPAILVHLFRAMYSADHIHLRCPGNIGLLGCLVQVAFPHKKKTAKYAGNWDPDSPQPWSYRLQRWILNNSFLTRNMQVLVYGEWPNQCKNILPFFTASYREAEWVASPARSFHTDVPVLLLFVGSLMPGKRPMLAVKAAEKLLQEGVSVVLHIYGDGSERKSLADYIARNALAESIFLHGNISAEELKVAYQRSHFLLFPSKSEGWPKAVAEAMSWGCLPVTTPVSCVPQMLGNGMRGVLISAEVESVVQAVRQQLSQPEVYREKCRLAMEWARPFTLERFESEIEGLL